MKIRSPKPVIFIVLVSFLVVSCAPLPPPGTALTPEERESARKTCIARYTAVGIAGGAIIGGLLGSRGAKTEGALIGAAAGGALAFAVAWGHCLSVYSNLESYPMADARTTANRIGYTGSQGSVVKVEDFYLNPGGVAPGGRVQMNGSYYVMAPQGSKDVKVTETRIVHYLDPSKNEWKELGAVDREVTAALGTRRAEGTFDLPQDVPEGKYRVTLKVASLGKEDSMTQDLKVGKSLATGPQEREEKHGRQPASSVAQAGAEQAGAKTVGGSSAGNKVTMPTKAKMAEVVSKSLNVRAEPSNKTKILAEIKKGERFKVVDSAAAAGEEKWYKIRLDNGDDGWVAGRYVKIVED